MYLPKTEKHHFIILAGVDYQCAAAVLKTSSRRYSQQTKKNKAAFNRERSDFWHTQCKIFKSEVGTERDRRQTEGQLVHVKFKDDSVDNCLYIRQGAESHYHIVYIYLHINILVLTFTLNKFISLFHDSEVLFRQKQTLEAE